jgi:uncharacterized small protein (DUF1192 family)
MTNGSTLSLPEIEDRIAILRDNIRQLTELAAALSGAADEARASDRIAAQQAELDRLIAQRDEMMARRIAAAPKAKPAAKKRAKRKTAKRKTAPRKTATRKASGKTVARKTKAAVKKKKKKGK